MMINKLYVNLFVEMIHSGQDSRRGSLTPGGKVPYEIEVDNIG